LRTSVKWMRIEQRPLASPRAPPHTHPCSPAVARKFPGYTAESECRATRTGKRIARVRPSCAHAFFLTQTDLDTKGIHEVAARRFCLVAADHPLVSAISENAEKLQMGEISMMPYNAGHSNCAPFPRPLPSRSPAPLPAATARAW
jgi:hypothetical protein